MCVIHTVYTTHNVYTHHMCVIPCDLEWIPLGTHYTIINNLEEWHYSLIHYSDHKCKT